MTPPPNISGTSIEITSNSSITPSTQPTPTPSKNIKLKIIDKKSVNSKNVHLEPLDLLCSSAPHFIPSPATAIQHSTSLPKYKKGTLLNNHLLGFEFSPPHSSSSNGIKCSRYQSCSSSSLTSLSRDQYILSSFRFITQSSFRPGRDELLEWNLIDAVIHPSTSAHSCTICLNSPLLSPRFLRCGHIFCLPCLIRYKESNGKVWNPCPICFEVVNLEDHKLVVPELLKEVSQSIKMILLNNKMIKRDNNPFNRLVMMESIEIDSFIINGEREMLTNHILFSRIDPQEDPFYIDCLEKSLQSLNNTSAQISQRGIQQKGEKMRIEKQKIYTDEDKQGELFFHQSCDGQNIFLCPLNIKILKEAFGGQYSMLPPFIEAPIIELSGEGRVDDLKRRKLKFLDRLPIGSQYSFVEIDLSSIVPKTILMKYESQLSRLSQLRQSKLQEDDRRARRALEIGNLDGRQLPPLIIRSQTIREELAQSSYEDNFPSFGERNRKSTTIPTSCFTTFANMATSLPNIITYTPHRTKQSSHTSSLSSSSSLSSVDLYDDDDNDGDGDYLFTLSIDDIKIPSRKQK